MIAVMLGGCIGAFIRFVITEQMKGRTSIFPSAVLFINLGGSFLIGLMAEIGLNAASPMGRLILTGCLGALTTFSAFSLEIIDVWRDGRRKILILYLIFSLLGCVLLCVAGYGLGYIIR